MTVTRRRVLVGAAGVAVGSLIPGWAEAKPKRPRHVRSVTQSDGLLGVDVRTINIVVGPSVSVRGDASNTGHTHHPSWPGSFTGGTDVSGTVATTGQTFNFRDFQNGVDVGTTSVDANNVTFNGCRFQQSANISNQGNNSVAQVKLYGSNITFNYCTFQPTTANYPTRLTGEEIEANTATFVEYGKAYQYAINGGGGFSTHTGTLLVDHCDFWGFGNALELDSSTVANPHVVQYSWFHHGGDPFLENVTANNFHNDCWLVNTGSYQGAQLKYSTLEIWGNTNLLAWQGTGSRQNCVVVGNQFSGDQESISIVASGTTSQFTFTDNIFSTRIGRAVGTGKPLRSWAVTDSGTGSMWRRNTYKVAASASTGNYPDANWGNPSWNGQYWHPGDIDSTGGHVADYTG